MRLSIARRVLCLAAVLAAFAGAARAQAVPEFQKILETYSAALDGNDVETLVGLYSPNGVFMREGMKAAIGQDALRAAYKDIFATLKVDLKFSLQEAEQSGDLGWARALSTGTVKVLATGAEIAEVVQPARRLPARGRRLEDPQLPVCFRQSRARRGAQVMGAK